MEGEREIGGTLSDLELFDAMTADEKKYNGRMFPQVTAKEYLEKNVHKIKWAKTVLEYGREFTPPSEQQARKMYEHWRKHKFPFKNGQCYRDSYVFGQIAEWPYVEGLVATIPGRVFFHAWNAKPGSLVVADVTWPLFSYFTSYMGIEFPVEFVLSLLKEKEKRKKKGDASRNKGWILYSWKIFEEPVKEFLCTRRTNSST